MFPSRIPKSRLCCTADTVHPVVLSLRCDTMHEESGRPTGVGRPPEPLDLDALSHGSLHLLSQPLPSLAGGVDDQRKRLPRLYILHVQLDAGGRGPQGAGESETHVPAACVKPGARHLLEKQLRRYPSASLGVHLQPRLA